MDRVRSLGSPLVISYAAVRTKEVMIGCAQMQTVVRKMIRSSDTLGGAR